MKYIVEVKYTNPAHEHVSLRRRVETVKRVVEAATEAEAINRAVRQQRALGFLIRESAVVNTGAVEQSLSAGSAANKPKKKVVGDEGETEIKKEPVKEETVEEDRAMSAAIAGGSVGSKILTGKMDPNFGYAANKMPPHLKAAQAKSDALSKVTKRPQAGTLAAKKANEEVEEVDEARKMSRVEWRMGTQDTVDANNYKIFKKLSATDPQKAQAFHDNLLKMKKKDVKEAVEDKKAGKSRKAAERMINLAKGKKNQINLEPFVDTHKVPMLPTTMGK